MKTIKQLEAELAAAEVAAWAAREALEKAKREVQT